jgi:hypothetical protein
MFPQARATVSRLNRPLYVIAGDALRSSFPTSDKRAYVNFVALFVRVTPSAERLHGQAFLWMQGTLPAKGTLCASAMGV